MISPADCADHLRCFLREAQNPDVGWAYYPGQRSRLEPTSWAHLALATETKTESDRSLDFFVQRARTDGLLIDESEVHPNIAFNGLATLVLLEDRTAAGQAAAAESISALATHAGVTLPPSPGHSQDNSLEGWPWIDQTFSWVEPTCWGLLPCKKWARRAGLGGAAVDDRIRSAELLLFNRVCANGGWNYGNATVLDRDLEPFVPTTALGLLALQDHPDHPAVVEGLRHLQTIWQTQLSGMALALTLICFRLFKLPTQPVEQHLVAQWERFQFFRNAHVAAMALYGLMGETNGVSAFRL